MLEAWTAWVMVDNGALIAVAMTVVMLLTKDDRHESGWARSHPPAIPAMLAEAGVVEAAALLVEHAVGVTNDPLLSNETFPRHEECSAAQVALLLLVSLRHVLYASLQLETQASDVAADAEAAAVVVAGATVGAGVLEQAVGVTKDPLLNGEYPRHEE